MSVVTTLLKRKTRDHDNHIETYISQYVIGVCGVIFVVPPNCNCLGKILQIL